MSPRAKFTYRELTPRDFPHMEALFGANGACGGCWCAWYRVESSAWSDIKGAKAKKLQKKWVESGQTSGILAFDGERPVGWCSFGLRTEFQRLQKSRVYKREDIAGVWSLPCFFIHKDYRGQGVAKGLLAAATRAIKKRGGKVAEGYPVPLAMDGSKLPAAFAFKGPESMFQAAGFEEIQRASRSSPLVRKRL